MQVCLDPNVAAEFLSGVLSAEVADRVESHLAGCPECRRLIAALARDCAPARAADRPSQVALAPTPFLGEAPTEPQPISAGTTVGRFLIIQRIGVGGMSVVYAAYDPHLDRKVALKFLRPDAAAGEASDARRLVGEAQAIARVNHPNIISVYDVGTFEERVYIAMEFVDGTTLTRWLRNAPRLWPDVLRAFVAAGRGLAAAHDCGVVHRDFKTDNVLVDSDGRVSVMDFGLARAAAATPAGDPDHPHPADAERERASSLGASLTRTGTLLGTPRYMAPEQFRGERADARSDQFSWCVALYEALYRTYPFYGETAAHLAPGLAIGDQLRPVNRGIDVPGWLRQALLRGMSLDPDQRFSSMNDLLLAIREPRTSRARWAALAAVPLVALGVLAARGLSREAAAADRAREAEARADAERERGQRLEAEAQQVRKQIERMRAEDLRRRERLDDTQIALIQRNRQLAELETRLDQIEEDERQRAELRAVRPPMFQEDLDRGLVQRYLERRRDAIEDCYHRGRQDNPMLGQWAELSLLIAPSGRVSWVQASGLQSSVVSGCIRALITRIHFPRSESATEAHYSFDFETNQSRTTLIVREGNTAAGEGEPGPDGVRCDPNTPLCGVE